MNKAHSLMIVVAAALSDGRDRWLLQQRLPGKHHAGLWEFPGGKVDPSEGPRPALCRELAEELALSPDPAIFTPLGFAEEPATGGRPTLLLLLYAGAMAQAAPVARLGQNWRWCTREEAAALPLAPLDRALLPLLPSHVGLRSS